MPEYDPGEIFLTRIISYLGDSFQMHDPRCFPAEYKNDVVNMIQNKMFYISETGNDVKDYMSFMKLAGPYWMSCTHPNPDVKIFSPDHHKEYYGHVC